MASSYHLSAIEKAPSKKAEETRAGVRTWEPNDLERCARGLLAALEGPTRRFQSKNVPQEALDCDPTPASATLACPGYPEGSKNPPSCGTVVTCGWWTGGAGAPVAVGPNGARQGWPPGEAWRLTAPFNGPAERVRKGLRMNCCCPGKVRVKASEHYLFCEMLFVFQDVGTFACFC
jgi:hypothetical protein